MSELRKALQVARSVLGTVQRNHEPAVWLEAVDDVIETIVEALSTPDEPVASELLMMFIRDCYKSPTGKISKSTALATMKYVSGDDELQRLVNISNWDGITNHSPQRELSDDEIINLGWHAGFRVDWSDPADGSKSEYGFLDESVEIDNEPFIKLVRAAIKAAARGK